MPQPGLEAAFEALRALGWAYRGDWADFDGRQLRDELDSWGLIARQAAEGVAERAIREQLQGWAGNLSLCLEHGSWREHCGDRHAAEARAS